MSATPTPPDTEAQRAAEPAGFGAPDLSRVRTLTMVVVMALSSALAFHAGFRLDGASVADAQIAPAVETGDRVGGRMGSRIGTRGADRTDHRRAPAP